jgi:preprotein translocase subunit SecF
MNIFPKTPTFDILGARKPWIIGSIVLTLLTLFWPLVSKPNWGVDFAGGTELQVQFTGDVDAGQGREAIEAAGIAEPNVQLFGDPAAHEFLVRVRRATLFTNEEFRTAVDPKVRASLPGVAEGAQGLAYNEDEGDQVTVRAQAEGGLTTEKVREAFEANGFRLQDVRAITEGSMYSVLFRGVSDKVEQALSGKFASLRPDNGFLRRVEQVGASVGNELKVAAVKALLLSILLILLYIGFRFDFAFATGAVVSLAHDAVIVVGYYLVSGAELNTNTIAAVLTIVGYSVNDTVIIFDRIRENRQKHKGRDLYRLINDSVNETLSRTLITHFTVMLSLTGLIFFTVGTLREFALAMLVGVVTGTYSSVYVAGPIVLWIEDIQKARREAAAAGKHGDPRTAQA